MLWREIYYMKSIWIIRFKKDFFKFGQQKQIQQDLNKWLNIAYVKRITG